VPKYEALPKDIQWHLIGHLQSNKVKYIAPFVSLIHSIDSFSLLKEVNKQAAKANRVIDVLLQVHIASEETKFGFGIEDLKADYILSQTADMQNIRIAGLMGMASFTEDNYLIEQEFSSLAGLYARLKAELPQDKKFNFTTLSMGMSSDWGLALNHGATHLRIGSTIFGSRI
jgi:pyridoxal phosphate enzyme (YggS family)